MQWYWIGLVAAGFAFWFGILVAPWRPWSTLPSFSTTYRRPADLSDVTVVIPARDEEDVLGGTIDALGRAGRGLRVVVVDDESSDATGDVARANKTGLESLRVVDGRSLPDGWSGKLWALEQGRELVETPYLLLLDADIVVGVGVIESMREQLIRENLGYLSLMARLRMQTFWERLLMPAFVYFFRLLYPFRLSNSSNPLVAAGAGGCAMLDAAAVADIGGFEAIRGAVIDDCAMARVIKNAGYRTWIGLTNDVVSVRRYPRYRDISEMVARTAFTQLRYSVLLLLLTTIAAAIAYIAPLFMLALSSSMPARLLAGGAVVSMLIGYFPTVRYYGLRGVIVFSLPVVGTMYIAMTWVSAIRYWRGERSKWKNRRYARTNERTL